MRRHLLLFINGKQYRVTGSDAFLMLSDFLRNKLGLPGTKVVCSEGDCGSCSVLCGRIESGDNSSATSLHYVPIDACILRMFQLDGCHLITVEGLKQEEALTPVQQAMVDCHGSQCGFCTPGFVITMTGILENLTEPSQNDFRRELTGNLCRCTGYAPILEAGQRSTEGDKKPLNHCFPPASMIEAFDRCGDEAIQIESLASTGSESQTVFIPTTLAAATNYLADHPAAKIVAGSTDLSVQINKRNFTAQHWIDLGRVTELNFVEVDESQIRAGARTTWSTLESITKQAIPQFYDVISRFGSPQIRNVGTIGGNIINASPIADSLPFLFVSDAKLEIAGDRGTRTVNINQFYHGYKQIDLQPGEILKQVVIPIPADDSDLRLYKVSRRRDMDISTFTAAIKLQRAGTTIKRAAIACGGVGPVVLRLPKTEQFLQNRELSLETMKLAGDLAVDEITPISDVRGGSQFRYQLTRNVLLKFFYQTCRSESAV